MNTRTQGIMGKILLQTTLALAVFAALTQFARAETEVTQLDQLFESQAVMDVKRYYASQTEQFSDAELQLAARVTDAAYELDIDTKHLYAAATDQGSESWPLWSLRLQNGDVNVKVGSKYLR